MELTFMLIGLWKLKGLQINSEYIFFLQIDYKTFNSRLHKNYSSFCYLRLNSWSVEGQASVCHTNESTNILFLFVKSLVKSSILVVNLSSTLPPHVHNCRTSLNPSLFVDVINERPGYDPDVKKCLPQE